MSKLLLSSNLNPATYSLWAFLLSQCRADVRSTGFGVPGVLGLNRSGLELVSIRKLLSSQGFGEPVDKPIINNLTTIKPITLKAKIKEDSLFHKYITITYSLRVI